MIYIYMYYIYMCIIYICTHVYVIHIYIYSIIFLFFESVVFEAVFNYMGCVVIPQPWVCSTDHWMENTREVTWKSKSAWLRHSYDTLRFPKK